MDQRKQLNSRPPGFSWPRFFGGTLVGSMTLGMAANLSTAGHDVLASTLLAAAAGFVVGARYGRGTRAAVRGGDEPGKPDERKQLNWTEPYTEQLQPFVFVANIVNMPLMAILFFEKGHDVLGYLFLALTVSSAFAAFLGRRRQVDVFADEAGILLERKSGTSDRVPWNEVERIESSPAGSCAIHFRRKTLGGRKMGFQLPPRTTDWAALEHPLATWMKHRVGPPDNRS